jgi:hypothetical protein
MSVAINGTNGITFNDGSLQPSAPVGKNKIINGDMRVDQRNGTATINGTGVTYNVDRWLGRGVASAGVFTLAQDTNSPANFTNSLKATVTTADSSIASASSYRVQQSIEGYNMEDLNWGTSDAQSVTLSFWVRSSVTGTFGGSVANGDYNRFNVFSYTISSADTWEYKTVTIAGDTSGTWVTNNTLALRLNFSLGAGSTLLASAGSWGSSAKEGVTGQTNVIATNSATFYVTGVQLEANTTATPFEHLQYTTQLQLCQRYYTKLTATNAYSTFGFGTAATNARMTTQYHFPTTMRAAPSTSYSGTLSVLYGTGRTNITSSPDSQLNPNGGYVNYDVSGTPFTAITYSGLIGANNDVNCSVEFNSEL